MPKRVEVEITRVFEDGAHEIRFPNGRRERIYFKRCDQCQSSKPESDFRPDMESRDLNARSNTCAECETAYEKWAREELNKKLRQMYGAKWAIEHQVRAAAIAKVATYRRFLALRAATPHWVDRDAIAAVYAKAREKSKRTGRKYHVDHIWPIQNPNCCGLHVPWNLRVITAEENCSKGNRLPGLTSRPAKSINLSCSR